MNFIHFLKTAVSN